MGNVLTYEPKVQFTPELDDTIQRVRYDFEYTKAELLRERFTQTYLDWCKGLNVKSRAQAYGRGFFPLESSLDYDIPECESWTMTWLRHRLGEEMSEEDYRRGRAYTMVNKYVSSAAHLRGKRLVSCEEMTNTYTVFNMTLELLKIGGDQTAISGVTHSILPRFQLFLLKKLRSPDGFVTGLIITRITTGGRISNIIPLIKAVWLPLCNMEPCMRISQSCIR